jgi:DHA1 family multidrug resistance protein-like MFS transporter
MARRVEVVLILRTIQGMFTGTIAAAATLVAATTPKDRLSYALGFIASSTFIGYALGPSLGGLCAEWLGYRPTFFIGSGMLLVGFFLVLLFIRESPPSATTETREKESGEQRFNIGAALRRPYLPLLVVFLFLRFSRSLPFSFIALYIQELQGTVRGASAVTGLVSGAAGITAGIAGLTLTRLGDRFDRIKLVGVFVGLAAVLAFPIYFAPGLTGFVLAYMGSSFFLGSTNPLLESYLSSMTSAGSRGVLFGTQAFVSSIGWFLAPVTGSLVAIAFGTRSVFLLFSLTLALTFVIVMAPHGIGAALRRIPARGRIREDAGQERTGRGRPSQERTSASSRPDAE